jgi:uncharacterized peroxidase-related enzyme
MTLYVATDRACLVWIETVSEQKAIGDLKRAYEAVLRSRGKIANIMRAQSLNPNALRAFLDLYVTLVFGKSGLSRSEREMVATVISAQNQCNYCVSHHGEALRFYLKNGAQLDAFERGQQPQNLSPRAKALTSYALKLTQEPSKVGKQDVDALRAVGISDSEILDLVLLTGYMNLVTRIAQGLGVEHDEQEAREYRY